MKEVIIYDEYPDLVAYENHRKKINDLNNKLVKKIFNSFRKNSFGSSKQGGANLDKEAKQ